MYWQRNYLVWVSVLLALAILSFYALQATTEKNVKHQATNLSPDARATDIYLIATSDTGKMKYTINAKQLTHYKTRNHSLFSQPTITIVQKPETPEWKITADVGEAFGGTEEVFLKGHVNATQDTTIITTDHILVNQTRDTAETDAHVTIITPESFIEADGLHAQLHTKHVTLLHNVRGLHVPQTVS